MEDLAISLLWTRFYLVKQEKKFERQYFLFIFWIRLKSLSIFDNRPLLLGSLSINFPYLSINLRRFMSIKFSAASDPFWDVKWYSSLLSEGMNLTNSCVKVDYIAWSEKGAAMISPMKKRASSRPPQSPRRSKRLYVCRFVYTKSLFKLTSKLANL